jgi:glycosyltransferase involved in cell wall biosynthesis
MTESCLATVAICTWNRSRLLAQTLEGLTKIVTPAGLGWEILVVDNRSTDQTRPVTESFINRLPLRYVFEPTLGLCEARNRAFAEARGQYVIFIDDDVLVAEQWLSSFASAARRFPVAAALGGPIEPWWAEKPDPLLMEIFPRLKMGFCAVDHKRDEGPLPPGLDIYGANMAYKRAALGSLRFDPRLGQRGRNEKRSDETEFVSRLRARGGEVIWVPGMRVQHYVDPSRMRLAYLRRVTVGEGRADTRLNGIPDGAQILGAPRWLVRKCLGLRVRALLARSLRRRRSALEALRQHDYLRGVIGESWVMRREQRQDGSMKATSQV